MIKEALMRFLPERTVTRVRKMYSIYKKSRKNMLPVITEDTFKDILINDIEIKSGDTVFIHSSVDKMSLDFPFYRILSLIQNVVGDDGTILFPTYPRLVSYKYLLSGEVFDVINTPSYTGILNEFARRQKNAVRSLHPTKSVCSIGRYARELTSTHQKSPYPYDQCSPYYKIMEYDGKIIGLGVSTSKLSFVHCIDDALKEKFPVAPYHEKLFQAKCINYERNIEMVDTFAHNTNIMMHNISRFVNKYVPADVCRDMTIYRTKFFRAKAQKLFELLMDSVKKEYYYLP